MKLIPVWHGYHNTLISFLSSVKDRIKEIKIYKPKSEHALRKRLIKPVKGRLPVEVGKTGAAHEKAVAAYIKAGAACDKTWVAYDKAYQKHLPELEALHAQECPNCPWDGKTIFPWRGED